MEKTKFTREEMVTMIDMLNAMATDEKYLSVHLTRNCPFWKNQEIKENCPDNTCLFCISNNMIAFLDIVKDIIIKGKSPIDALAEESPAKAQTTKIRLYSEEDYASNSIDWLTLTEEQFRLLEYLANNDCLADCIDYEVCNDADFTTV